MRNPNLQNRPWPRHEADCSRVSLLSAGVSEKQRSGRETGRGDRGSWRGGMLLGCGRTHAGAQNLPDVVLFRFLQVEEVTVLEVLLLALLLLTFDPWSTACLPGLLTSAAAATAFWSWEAGEKEWETPRRAAADCWTLRASWAELWRKRNHAHTRN